MNDIRKVFGLRKIINAAGPVSVLGGGFPNVDAVAAANAVLPISVEVSELQALASNAIASAFGAEAGFVTAGSAAGIAIAVAAAMTGTDRTKVAQLPDTSGMRNVVVMQAGHDADFGARVSQMIRLTGAKVAMVGDRRSSTVEQLKSVLRGDVAAAVFVISHHAVQAGMIALPEFCATCRAAGVPVIVDAAGEHDLREPIAAGADLAIASGHKNYGALTSGIVAGRRVLIDACLLQDSGIGRPMKVGKEGIISVVAALTAWQRGDPAKLHAEWDRRASVALHALRDLPHLKVELAADLSGSPLHRVRISGASVQQITESLRESTPSIRVWTRGLVEGYFELDPRTVSDDEMIQVCHAVRRAASEASFER